MKFRCIIAFTSLHPVNGIIVRRLTSFCPSCLVFRLIASGGVSGASTSVTLTDVLVNDVDSPSIAQSATVP